VYVPVLIGYLFVIEGTIESTDQSLAMRDAIGITEADEVHLAALSDSQVLAIEVPMLA